MKESNEGGLIKRQENGAKGSRNPDVQKMALKKGTIEGAEGRDEDSLKEVMI